MSRWRDELSYLGRYGSSGLLNTFVGFFIIFGLMGLGFSPYIANIVGYLVGFVFSFILSKKFVFRSNGHYVSESIRYLIAFMICFFLNLAALKFALLHVNGLLSQLIAAVVYSGTMYLFIRYFVFTDVVQARLPSK